MEEVRAFAPATIGNVSCGFDVFGLALSAPGDEVVVRKTRETGVRISLITGDNGRLPTAAEHNTAGVAVLGLLDQLGSTQGLELEIHKRMPLGSGMGSSAASAAAAVFAANYLLGEPLDKRGLLPFTLAAEKAACGSGHADNVAPSLLGGFILVRSYDPLEVISIPVARPLYCALVHPDVEIRTEDARALLPATVPLKSAVAQWGNTAGLVAGLYSGDYELVFRSVQDFVAEPYRKNLIPYFDEARRAALKAGGRTFGISGSGPSVFILTEERGLAERAASAVTAVFDNHDIGSSAYVSSINTEGARLLAVDGQAGGRS